MNRRSFIAGILAACVAPKLLLPKAKDHARWRVTRNRHGFYIAEYRFATPPNIEDQEWVSYQIGDSGQEELVRPPEPMKPSFVDRCVFRNRPIPQGEWHFIEWKGPPSFVPAQT